MVKDPLTILQQLCPPGQELQENEKTQIMGSDGFWQEINLDDYIKKFKTTSKSVSDFGSVL